jgi:ubiquinone/menaquinone biosynthesis C-methylase UbiE
MEKKDVLRSAQAAPDSNQASLQEQQLLTKVHRAYSAPTWWYDFRGFFILLFAHRTTLWSLIGFFEKNISDLHLELPVGSGTLTFFTLLWHKIRNPKAVQPAVIAIDYSETQVQGSRLRLRPFKGVQCLKGDVSHLNFPDAHFHSINVPNGIHCFPNDATALKELFRVLGPGRTLAANVVLQPRGARWLRSITSWIYRVAIRSGLLVRAYEVEEIRDLIQKTGFSIEDEYVNGNTFHFVARRPSGSHDTPKNY